MKKILLLLLLIPTFVYSQENNYYLAETEGYFHNSIQTEYGIITTDNSCNKILLINNNQITTLVNKPGCGRYYSINKDRNKIAFKYIDEQTFLQKPAVLNLKNLQITFPETEFNKAEFYSCPVFVQNTLFYRKGNFINDKSIHNDASFDCFDCNLTKNLVTYPLKVGLLIQNTLNGENIVLCDSIECLLPKFSINGNYVAFQSVNGGLFIYNISNNNLEFIGNGCNFEWNDKTDLLVFQRNFIDDLKSFNSDIYIYNCNTKEQKNISNTNDIQEMSPSFALNSNSIIYHTYNRREIVEIDEYGQKTLLFLHPLPLQISNFQQEKNKSFTGLSKNVPYVHQVFDTPDWHWGHYSCAPTTCAMIFGYYNTLPYWPEQCISPSSHYSYYGNYVCEKYRYNEQYYNLGDPPRDSVDPDAYGGYGYMWGNGSPNSYMANYLNLHGINSNNQYWTNSCTWQQTLNEINQDFPHSLCNYLTTAGHLVLAIGYINNQHTALVHDPYGDKNAGYSSADGDSVLYDWPGWNNGYQNLGGIAWSVQAQSTHKVYNDTIIDNQDYNNGFFMENTAPSKMRYYRDNITGGYNGHFWYTYTVTGIDTCWVKWTATISRAANYKISAYIPSQNATTTSAQYNIHYLYGDTIVYIDQAANNASWIELGTFACDTGNNSWVTLGDRTSISSELIAFDAVKWEYVSPLDTYVSEYEWEQLHIYPNPASNRIYFSKEIEKNAVFQLFNSNSQLIINKKINNSFIDISLLPDGVYLYKITTKNKVVTDKLIIKKQ